MSIPNDIHQYIRYILEDVANLHILPRFGHPESQQIENKSSPSDQVTIADKDAEKDLSRRLRNTIPGSIVLGEEAVAADPNIMVSLSNSPPEYLWILDPIDGTRQFINGTTGSGTLLCLCKNSEPIMSWQYHFHSGDLIITEKGAGVTLNGEKASYHAAWPKDEWQLMLSRRLSNTDECAIPIGRRHGSIASVVDYAGLINGAKVPLHTLAYRTTYPWDHVCGALMAEELGLCAARLDGSRYRWNDITREGLLIAPPDKWNMVLRSIYPNQSKPIEKMAFEFKF